MRRPILITVALLLMCAGTCHASITGSVTLANIRLSTVTGYQFVDFSAAGALTPYIGWKLKVCDSSSKCATGFIRSAGTEEKISETELVTNGGFDTDSDWTKESGWAIADGKATCTKTGAAAIYQIPLTVGTLVKNTYTITDWTTGAVAARIGTLWLTARTAIGTYTGYATAATALAAIYAYGAGTAHNFSVDNVSFKQVLTPSATGVTITSTRGGPHGSDRLGLRIRVQPNRSYLSGCEGYVESYRRTGRTVFQ